MPNLDTFSVMFLESLDVLGLATSYVLLQITQPGLIRPHLVSRWLFLHRCLNVWRIWPRNGLQIFHRETPCYPTSQSLTSPAYLKSFLSKASSKPSSQGTELQQHWLQFGWGTSVDQGPPTTASLLQTSGCLQMFFWQELACPHLWERRWFSWRVWTALPTPVQR